jgi:Zn-dependent protease with chaperone function
MRSTRPAAAVLAAALPVILAALALGLGPAAHKASAQAAAPAPQGAAAATPSAGVREAEGPVPVPEPSPLALRYYRSGYVLWIVGIVWGLAVPLFLLFSGLSARLRDWARALGRNWFFTVAIYSMLFTVLSFLIDLPLAYYEGYVREHAYGLSNQTLQKWAGDALKDLAVGAVLGALTLWLPYLLLRKSPRRWWLYTGLVSVPFITVMLIVTPIWIAPLVNKFGPMKDQALERSILALAERAGIEGSRVFEVDKSVDTETINAYVTGFGRTKRIVLWDTILAKLDRREILFVMGHEMGHYVLGHVRQIVFVDSALILLGLWVVYRSADALIRRYRDRFGFSELGDVASLPLILLLFTLTLLVVTPLVLAFSRHNEHEADRFGLELTRDNHAAATAFVKLQHENLGVPRPGKVYKLWRAGHPVLGERIDFCNQYRPWEEGKPLKYGGLMRP